MAFTTTWSTIITSQTDADSPIDITLMESIRQNLIYAYEWIGQGYTPSTAHNHDGINSRTITLAANSVNSSAYIAASITSTKIGATAVERSHLKMTRGSWSVVNGASTTTLVTNHDSHWPLMVITGGSTSNYGWIKGGEKYNASSTSIDAIIKIEYVLNIGGIGTLVLYWDYHSS